MSHSFRYLITFAGLPPAIQFAGILFVTTEPAPITEFFPIVTPLRIIERAPMKTLSSITMGELAVFSFRLFILSCQSIGCESVSVIRQPLPTSTLFPIFILLVAFMVEPEMPTLLPMTISAPAVAILNTQGCIKPIEFDVTLLLHLKLFPMKSFPFFSPVINLINQPFLIILI